MDTVDRAISIMANTALPASLEFTSSVAAHEPGDVAARSERLLPPAFRGPNEHDDGPQNEDREGC